MPRKKESTSDLRNKIKYLEEEIVRKQERIEELEKKNNLLFKTAIKNSESKLAQTK